MTKLIISIIGITLLVSAGFIFGLPYLNKSEGHAKIEISPLKYDAGVISMADGSITKIYKIKNTGTDDLKISEIKTSCMCTTAILKSGENVSPEFGMHTNFPFWSQKIAPGEVGDLEVIYNPAFHGPKGVGKIIRAVYISSNDPENKKAQVRLSADVTL